MPCQGGSVLHGTPLLQDVQGSPLPTTSGCQAQRSLKISRPEIWGDGKVVATTQAPRVSGEPLHLQCPWLSQQKPSISAHTSLFTAGAARWGRWLERHRVRRERWSDTDKGRVLQRAQSPPHTHLFLSPSSVRAVCGEVHTPAAHPRGRGLGCPRHLPGTLTLPAGARTLLSSQSPHPLRSLIGRGPAPLGPGQRQECRPRTLF